MPYRFACDACGYNKRVYMEDYNSDDKFCDECGTVGCDHCFIDGLCEECENERLADKLALDNEDDGA